MNLKTKQISPLKLLALNPIRYLVILKRQKRSMNKRTTQVLLQHLLLVRKIKRRKIRTRIKLQKSKKLLWSYKYQILKNRLSKNSTHSIL